MPKKLFRAVYALNFITQAGFSFLVPAGLFLLGGWALRHYCGAGRWVLAAAIVLGVLCGFYSMIYFLVKSAGQIDPTESKGERDGTK